MGAGQKQLMNHPPTSELNGTEPEERLLTLDFAASTIANFFYSMGSQATVAVLPLYVIALGGSVADAGLVAGSLAVVALAFRPLVGYLVDAWRSRPLVMAGTFCFGLASLIYMVAGNVIVILAGRVLHGFGLSAYSTAANVYLARIAPPSRRGEAIGYFTAAQGLGLILGPATGFALLDWRGFSTLFIAVATSAGLATLASLLARERYTPGQAARPRWNYRTGIIAPEALREGWISLCMGLAFGPVNAFIALYAKERGMEQPGLYFAAQALALIVARVIAGKAADTMGRVHVLIPGLLLMAISLLGLTIAYSLPQFLLAAALFGLGFGMAQPATMAMLVDNMPLARRGIAISTFFIGFDVGIAASSIAFGLLANAFGFTSVWVASAIAALSGLVALIPRKQGG